ncbi:MAG: MFS transporter [Acidimicrobiia bacterium]|nr:MFS transporter [Acidimicrobiia bacterium]
MQTTGTPPKPTALAPSRARYWVIVLAVTLAILAYIDRVCISMAAPHMSEDLGLDKKQMGSIFSAFALAYALFEIPGGWLGDWMGPRRVLMRIVLWWSAFTAFTGAVWNLSSLWITRFLFGAGEAGCFPNLTKSFTTWLPQQERVRAQGIMWTFARWGGAFTPPLVFWVFKIMNWRWAFVLFGAIGLVWAFFFYRWYRDNPRDHKSVNEAELALLAGSEETASGHGNVPWGKLIASRSVWLLWLQYFLLAFPWYFYITWLPTYLKEVRGLQEADVATYAILPLLLGGLGSLFCGLISAPLARVTGSVKLARRLLGSAGFFGAGSLLIVSVNTENALMAMIFMGMASFCNDLVMPGSWGACMDVGGKYAGTLSGSMNMMGNMAGFVAPWLGGYILEDPVGTVNAAFGWMGVQWGEQALSAAGSNWNVFLYLMAGVYLLGTLCWPLIDPVKPLEER